MQPVVKTAAGTTAVVAGGAGIGLGVDQLFKLEPDASLLFTSDEFEKIYKGKFGDADDNKTSFVDPDKNNKWWDWIYKNRDVENISNQAKSSQFKAVTSSFSTTDDKALNKVCRVALTSLKKDLVNILYKEDVWRYCSKSGIVPEHVRKPPKPTLVTDSDINKFGGKNKSDMVGDVAANEEWWNWVYENKFKLVKEGDKKDSLHNDFKSKVNKGYAPDGTDGLNKVCKGFYDKKTVEVVNITVKTNIWQYCSKNLKAPRDVKNEPKFYTLDSSESKSHTVTDSKSIGAVTGNKKLLVSDIDRNEEMWNWLYENRLKPNLSIKDKKDAMHTSFKNVTLGYNTSNNSALNKVCRTAYEKKKSELEADGEKYRKSISIYCTKEGTENQVIMPTQ